MTAFDDQSAIIRGRLVDELERLLDTYCPGWIEHLGRGWLAPNGKGDLGSWNVQTGGMRRGQWVRYSQVGDGGRPLGGDPLALIAYVQTGSTRVDARTFAEARAFLGMGDEAPDPAEVERRRRAAEDRRRAAAQAAAAARAAEHGRARTIWRAAGPAAGTLVEAWLAARGLAGVPVPPSIRFHPALPYFWQPDVPRGAPRPPPVRVHCGPAMVAVITHGQTGQLQGVHMTYLSADGTGKAAVVAPDGTPLPARKIRGEVRGGHVRLAPRAGHLLIGEGIETTMTVWGATGIPAWAALSLGNLGAALPDDPADPDRCTTVTLCLDADEARPDDAERAKSAAALAHRGRGLDVRMARPPAGMDFNSWLMALLREGAADDDSTSR